MNVRIGILVILIALAMSSRASAQTCYFVYQYHDVWCLDFQGSSECHLIPVYSEVCEAATTPYTPSLPPSPLQPGGGGTGTTPEEPWVKIDYVDDTDHMNLRVRVSADPRLDNFQLLSRGTPYGGNGGTGAVTVGGLPAVDLGSYADITVQGCSSTLGICAFGRTSTSTTQRQKTEFGSATGIFFSEFTRDYNRNVTVKYKERNYAVRSGPGNSKFEFEDVVGNVSYQWNDQWPSIVKQVCEWKVLPGMFFANSAVMMLNPSLTGYIDRPYTTTISQRCGTNNTIGGYGLFVARIDFLAMQGPEGINPAVLILNRELSVNVP